MPSFRNFKKNIDRVFIKIITELGKPHTVELQLKLLSAICLNIRNFVMFSPPFSWVQPELVPGPFSPGPLDEVVVVPFSPREDACVVLSLLPEKEIALIKERNTV